MAAINEYSADNIEQLLTEHIAEEFGYDRPDLVLTSEFKLIEQRLIDSMGIFRLVSFMEEQFGIAWEPEELVLENFETIGSLRAFVLSKLEA